MWSRMGRSARGSALRGNHVRTTLDTEGAIRLHGMHYGNAGNAMYIHAMPANALVLSIR